MKTYHSVWKNALVMGVAVAISTVTAFGAEPVVSPSLVAHEWGTFTSVQNADGRLLQWKPLETSALPKFVHDWTTAGPGVTPGANPSLFLKVAIMDTLQRMETPVIYFYGKEAQRVSVRVGFPQGKITEWYPQASAIGPSMYPKITPNAAMMLSCGSPAPAPPRRDMAESGISWKDLYLTPAANSAALPVNTFDAAAAHYFAARETDSMLAYPDPLTSGAATNQPEKFLFYRGVGNFGTALQVSMPNELSVSLTNSGAESLADLFVLQLKEGKGGFTHVTALAHGKQLEVPLSAGSPTDLSRNILAEKLSREMVTALQGQGLYLKEAKAMVRTWEASWFQEDGIRVLYLLPRSWTDKTLPLTITPAPTGIVRVMVGRAEMLSRHTETTLTKSLVDASRGNAAARQAAVAQLRGLGRFADPALGLTLRNMKTNEITEAFRILDQARTPTAKAVSASL